MRIRTDLSLSSLAPKIENLFQVSAAKVRSVHESWDPQRGSPVFTVGGRYVLRGWTEWTMGFHIGSALIQFEATGDRAFYELGRSKTIDYMAPHVSHVGVHDHGFNNISTYGALRRLMLEGRVAHDQSALETYELALKVSGAIQAARCTRTKAGPHYIYSFNGPHSLFSDTMRSLRSLALAHQLGHELVGEGDLRINLLGRAIEHAKVTAQYNVYYGEGRDIYDVAGRVAHESIFNVNDGQYRCPSSQQGYSPFTTWTRGASWVILGFAEQLEFLETVDDQELEPFSGRETLLATCERAARVAADYYIDGYTCQDGIPFWDQGAPGLAALSDPYAAPSDPYNAHEPVDSSAAVITAQGLVRLGCYLAGRGDKGGGERLLQAGLTVADTLLSAPYLSEDPQHQGLLLHSVYHRPNGWDKIPAGERVPCGESTMWGDYHLMELALLLQRMAEGCYLTFF